MNDICEAKRDLEFHDGGVILHLACERYAHDKGLHKCVLIDGVIIYFEGE
jgi:hypothetical protein